HLHRHHRLCHHHHHRHLCYQPPPQPPPPTSTTTSTTNLHYRLRHQPLPPPLPPPLQPPASTSTAASSTAITTSATSLQHDLCHRLHLRHQPLPAPLPPPPRPLPPTSSIDLHHRLSLHHHHLCYHHHNLIFNESLLPNRHCLLFVKPILNRRRIDVNFSLERLHRYWMSQDEPAESTEVSSTGCFHAGLTESSAESELTTLFKREWFKDMRVVGQFNKGFIICQHEKDLFIVDQHASDEKYRFECLCANHQFTSQPLVSPQQLTLNAVQEHVLEENMEVFANNGFAFSVDENAPLGRRYCLVSAPMSEGKVFGRAGM
uniref:MutL_C domain-containing protein n=1 Tax=Mesocestoides corti TaxID=53468 RepID=A0A5K3FEL2_MESCO